MASRDLPSSFRGMATGWYTRLPGEMALRGPKVEETEEEKEVRKVQMKNLWPAFISGAGLFSDGYVNNSTSTINTCLLALYGDKFSHLRAISNVSSIAFAGTIAGMLIFGYVLDHVARKGGMLTANIGLILFTLLCGVATWGRTPEGTFTAITVVRFFLGVAIGAEYPTLSVIALEFANQLPPGHRNRYFCWFTNSCIDAGFVISAFVPLVLLWIFSPRHLQVVWRLTMALGCIPPLSLFFMRRKMKNSEAHDKYSLKTAKNFPYWPTIKFYWFRLAVVLAIWFIYDFSSYSFGSYSLYILSQILPSSHTDYYKTFGWNVVFNLFYIPGSFLGGFATDYFGPRITLTVGLILQGIIGFGMTAGYDHLKHEIAGFVVVFGIFSTLGEFGAGNNVGCLALKTSATPIRGQYYGLAAAIGKAGAFVGTYVFPSILNKGGPGSDKGIKEAFYISSSLCIFSGLLAFFCLPSVGQDAIEAEDIAFAEYLASQGFDVSQMGNGTVQVDEESFSSEDEKKMDAKVVVV